MSEMLMFDEKEVFSLSTLINNIKDINEVEPINKKCVHKKNPQQVVISDVSKIYKEHITHAFSNRNNRKVNAVFYCQSRPNLECEVCFDHPLDHYPLMLIFEMARQLAIATSHQFYNIPYEGYMAIVSSLSFDFKYFAEIDQPLIIVCLDIDVNNKVGFLTRTMNFLFLQKTMLCVCGTGTVRFFKKSIYKKMRKGNRCKILKEKDINVIPTSRDLLLSRKDSDFPMI